MRLKNGTIAAIAIIGSDELFFYEARCILLISTKGILNMKILLKTALSVISLRVFSRLYGRLVRMRHPRFLIKPLIRLFKESYSIDMDNYKGEIDDYRSLSDFFVRPLDPEKRRLNSDENAIVSPADGKLTDIQTIHSDSAAQVKGKTYSVSQMTGCALDFSSGWHVAVVYLSPSNYHRFHYPVSGTVTRYLHTGPRLYPVNDIGLNHVDRLFIQNERIVTEMKVGQYTCYFIAVGATFVGSIKMEFIDDNKNNRKRRHRWIDVNRAVQQVQEMGRFEMGSTIVMVVPKQMAAPIPSSAGQTIETGQSIFRLNAS